MPVWQYILCKTAQCPVHMKGALGLTYCFYFRSIALHCTDHRDDTPCMTHANVIIHLNELHRVSHQFLKRFEFQSYAQGHSIDSW